MSYFTKYWNISKYLVMHIHPQLLSHITAAPGQMYSLASSGVLSLSCQMGSITTLPPLFLKPYFPFNGPCEMGTCEKY